ATETPVPTPTLASPSISSIAPKVVTCGDSLTIRGQRFGQSSKAVDGEVRIDGVTASVVSWSMSEIEVHVPRTARPGDSRLLEVIIAGNTATGVIHVTC